MTLFVASEMMATVDQVRADTTCGCVTDTTPDSDVIVEYIHAASDMIATVTGLRVAGRQAVVARPTRMHCDEWMSECSCGCGLDVIPLSDERPNVTQVKIDGETLSSSYWWMHRNRTHWVLARKPLAGELAPRAWPSNQKRYLDDTEDDTFAIYFTQGIHVDTHIVTAAALEIVCDLIAEDNRKANALEGVSEITVGGTTARLDEDRLMRIANGELGPMTRRLMGVMSPQGRSTSEVWAPELTLGWDLNLEIDGWVGWGS